MIEPAAISFGIPKEQLANTATARKIQQIHMTAALYATRNVIAWTEQFAAKNNKKLMLILSFAQRNMEAALEDKPRFDQSLLDWLKGKPYPIINARCLPGGVSQVEATGKGLPQALLCRPSFPGRQLFHRLGHQGPGGEVVDPAAPAVSLSDRI